MIIKHLFDSFLGNSPTGVPRYGEKPWETVALGPRALAVSQGFSKYLGTTVWLFPSMSWNKWLKTQWKKTTESLINFNLIQKYYAKMQHDIFWISRFGIKTTFLLYRSYILMCCRWQSTVQLLLDMRLKWCKHSTYAGNNHLHLSHCHFKDCFQKAIAHHYTF